MRIIENYYEPGSRAYEILILHSRCVAEKALEIAARVKELNPDFQFVEEAAMLHDIGIFMTDCPKIGCNGEKPYLAHGYLGRQLLEKEGLPKHALVCERHTGVGLTLKDIIGQKLPLPKREMMPVSLEEKIICFADKFYSKKDIHKHKDRSVRSIKKKFHEKFGEEKGEIFDEYASLFNYY